MKKFLASCVILIAALTASAQDLPVTGEGVKTVVVVSRLPFTVTAPANGADYLWKVPQGVAFVERDNAIDVTQAPNGELAVSVRVLAVDFDNKKVTRKTYTATVVIGGVKPPDPPPNPAPIAGEGLRMLIVYETADLAKYPPGQTAAMQAGEVREYLASHCPKVNGTAEARWFDKDTNMAAESATWRDAMKRPRGPLPWLVISNGKTGFEGALPNSAQDLVKLLKQYGGE